MICDHSPSPCLNIISKSFSLKLISSKNGGGPRINYNIVIAHAVEKIYNYKEMMLNVACFIFSSVRLISNLIEIKMVEPG